MHAIRLRGPWEQEPLAEGRVRWSRRFHKPTGLDAPSRVWLVIEDLHEQADVSLNDRLLAAVDQQSPARLDITTALQPYNVLTITLPASSMLLPVRLEIEDAS